MILSLTVYTGTAVVMAMLGWHVSQREQRRLSQGGTELPFLSWEIVTALLIYIAVSSARWLTSWDYNMYYSYYVSLQSLNDFSRENFEPGFHAVTWAMGRLGLSYVFYFAFWATLHIVLLYYALRHHKFLLPWVALCIFLGPYYVQWMSTLRQAVVECLLVVMVGLIVHRKFWIYLLLTLLAMTIHKMAVLLLPLYLVPLVKVRWGGRWLPYALLGLCVVLGSFPQWIQWCFDQAGHLFSMVGYGHYYRLFSTDSHFAFRFVMGPTRLCPLLTGIMIIWLYPAMRRMFASDWLLPAAYRFMLLGLGYLNLMGNTTQYLSRPGDLTRGLALVMTCYAMCLVWRQRRWMALAALCALNFYYIYYEIFKAVAYGGSIYTPELYHTFLF